MARNIDCTLGANADAKTACKPRATTRRSNVVAKTAAVEQAAKPSSENTTARSVPITSLSRPERG